MNHTHPGRRHFGTVLVLAGVAVPVAGLRYFAKGWLAPLAVPTVTGSLLVSLTVVLTVALVLLFPREARAPDRRFVRPAVAYTLLALWCEALVIAGILWTAHTGADTYYEGPWELVMRTFPEPARHAVAHLQGFGPRLALGLGLGAGLYRLSRRPPAPTPP